VAQHASHTLADGFKRKRSRLITDFCCEITEGMELVLIEQVGERVETANNRKYTRRV
jgi:hypothetical protein